jgi:hypothetical protein
MLTLISAFLFVAIMLVASILIVVRAVKAWITLVRIATVVIRNRMHNQVVL